MATAKRVIQIDVTTTTSARKAVQDLNRRLRSIEGNSERAARSLKKMGSNINLMTLYAKAFVAIDFGRRITSAADTMTLLSARTALVAESTVGLNEAMDDLFAISQQTRSSIEASGSLYARLGLATQELGVSHEDLLKVVQTTANTLLLSGAGAQEAKASMIQLSQAFAKGKLDGDEFRTMTENNVFMFDLLAKQLGVTRKELFEMSKAGQLTTERILPALANAAEDTQKKVDDMGWTFGQAGTLIQNEFLAIMRDAQDEIQWITEGILGLLQGFREFAEGVRNLARLTAAWQMDQISTWDFLNTKLEDVEDTLDRINGKSKEGPLEIVIDRGRTLPIPPPPPARPTGRPEPEERDPLAEFRESIIATRDELERLPEYVRILDELHIEGAISADLHAKELEKLIGVMKEAEPAIDEFSQAMKNAIAKSVVDSIGDMTDAFVDFALTGKQSFRELTASILADISKMILRMVVLNTLKSAFAGTSFGNFLFPTGTPSFATGTPYVPQDGLAYLHKGERVVPASQNTVTNNNNYTTERPISIVNVTDPGQIGEIMGGSVGEEVVINHIRRNPDLIRQVLS